MRKILVCTVFAAMTASVFSQEQGKFRLNFDAVYTDPFGFNSGVADPVLTNIGFGFNLQLGYNLLENMNVGIRYGHRQTVVPKNIYSDMSFPFLTTFSYYFANSGKNLLVPFVSGGFGVYRYLYHHPYKREDGNIRFGGMLTAGFEIQRFRLGIEYNLVQNSLLAPQSESVGVDPLSKTNSYFAVTAGFYFGGGLWEETADQRIARRETKIQKQHEAERQRIARQEAQIQRQHEIESQRIAHRETSMQRNAITPQQTDKTSVGNMPINKGNFFANASASNLGLIFIDDESYLNFNLTFYGGYYLINNLALVSGVGFQRISISGDSFNSIALDVGARYYFATIGDGGFFANGVLGLSKSGRSEAEFGLGLGVGYSFFLNNRVAIEPIANLVIPFSDSPIAFTLGVGISVFF
ncbi:MAG: hypothetical protein FWG79_07955 [Bacteroidales bacterium]|nr:hypothetical protein [Bacteroidales bacterium]